MRAARAVVVALLFAAAGMAQVELAPEVFDIASRLRCPVCVSETVAQSASSTAVEMREMIGRRLEAGESEDEILAYFQQRYGDWILLDPPRRGIFLVVWLLPVVVSAAIAAVAVVLAVRWTRRGREPIDVDPAALEAFRRDAYGGDGP